MAELCQAALLDLDHKIVNLLTYHGRPGPPLREDDGWDPCNDPATHQVAAGCEHEHVLTWPVCAGHAVTVARQRDEKDPGRCPPCKLRGCEGCRVLVNVAPLPEMNIR